MFTPATKEHYIGMMATMVENRIVELHLEGKTERDIFDIMTPWGTPYPSQASGIIKQAITAYESHKAIDEAKEAKS